MIAAKLEKVPNAFKVDNLRPSCVSLMRFGRRGMKPFMKIGSIPTCLLKLFLQRREMFSTRSERTSGTFTSLFTIFLTIEIRRVGKLELLVTSRFVSSHFPSLTTFARTSSAAYI